MKKTQTIRKLIETFHWNFSKKEKYFVNKPVACKVMVRKGLCTDDGIYYETSKGKWY